MFRRISKTIWMLSLTLCLLLPTTGCNTQLFQRRTVYVPDGQPVRLREPVRARVWVYVPSTNSWEPSVMTIPEGWYALSKK